MKTLKWLWIVSLLIVGFKAYGFVMRAYNSDFSGNYSGDMESFVGMVLIFAVLSVVIAFLWIVNRAKSAVVAGKNS